MCCGAVRVAHSVWVCSRVSDEVVKCHRCGFCACLCVPRYIWSLAPASLNLTDRWSLNYMDRLDDIVKNRLTKPLPLSSVHMTRRDSRARLWNMTWHCVQSAQRKLVVSNVSARQPGGGRSSCYLVSECTFIFAMKTSTLRPRGTHSQRAERARTEPGSSSHPRAVSAKVAQTRPPYGKSSRVHNINCAMNKVSTRDHVFTLQTQLYVAYTYVTQ